MNKALKYFLLILLVVIIVVALIIANAIYGNPYSKAKAKGVVNKYLMENYYDTDFSIYDIFYNFKDGYYHAEIISPTSIDSHFDIAVSRNKIVYDMYEDSVLSGWNTWERLDNAYREMTDEVLEGKDFPYDSEIAFGSIVALEDVAEDDFASPNYGIKLSELELDEDYDIKQLAITAGQIVFYAEDEEITFERASEILLVLKDEFDRADVPFYAIDFVLEKPRKENGTPSDDDSSIHTANFLYDDIYADSLAERIEQNHQLLMDYYDEQDELHKKENE